MFPGCFPGRVTFAPPWLGLRLLFPATRGLPGRIREREAAAQRQQTMEPVSS